MATGTLTKEDVLSEIDRPGVQDFVWEAVTQTAVHPERIQEFPTMPILLGMLAWHSSGRRRKDEPPGIRLVRLFVRRTALLVWLYFRALRPWLLRWGAADEEVKEALPGDEILPGPAAQSTRSITIDAPPSAVWPWLVQMGYKRGGLYSYDWLENVPVRLMKLGAEYHSADRIIPELQHLSVGDVMPITPQGGYTVERIEPQKLLLLSTRDADTGAPFVPANAKRTSFFATTWAFVLRKVEHNRTRLIVRARDDYRPRGLKGLPTFLLYYPEPVHFIMERKMLFGIKRRAEAAFRRKVG